MKLAIYLAGAIKKGHENDDYFWGDEEIKALRDALSEYHLSLLNPAIRTDDLSDQRSVFGRDMCQVFAASVVFVDARNRRGLGVGAEMMWAKMNKIPVVCWAPSNSHYRKDKATILGKEVPGFIHPFVEALSDKIVDTLEEGADWIRGLDQHVIKGPESIFGAMEYYKEHQLHHDLPMQECLRNGFALGEAALR